MRDVLSKLIVHIISAWVHVNNQFSMSGRESNTPASHYTARALFKELATWKPYKEKVSEDAAGQSMEMQRQGIGKLQPPF